MEKQTLNLLVVEDDEDDFVLLRHMLQSSLRQVTVERAATAREALGRADNGFDVCFFDYRLGPDNGLDLLREFHRRHIDAPVIFLTGQGDEEVAVEAMKAGATDYMLKSKLSEAALTRAIRYAINLHNKEMLLRHAREELRANSEALRAMFEASPIAIVELDREGRVVRQNPAARRMLGYGDAEVVGRRPPLSPAQAELFDSTMQRVLQGEQVLGLETTATRKDGGTLQISISVAPLCNAAGETVGTVSVLADITERKRAEEALRRSRDEWEITFNAMSEAVTFHDAGFKLLRANEAFRRLTEGQQGATCSQLVHGTDLPPPHCPLSRALLTRQPENSEFFEPHLGRFLSVRADPVLNTAGQVVSVVHVVQDITERRALEEQLHMARKMEAIGQLAGGIAHDFNNLLMVITSYSELMQDAVGDNPELRRDAEAILKAGRRAAALTQQLLAFSRKQVLAPQLLDLNAALRDISKLLPRLIGEDIELVFVPGADLWPVKADPAQIEQVIMNLAANARDAMPHGGKLILETGNIALDEAYARQHIPAIPGEFVRLAVTDTGVGIDPEVQPHIFEPFFTTKEKGKGTGLGLPSVYGVVKQSGGFIWVYSEMGHGTTFKVYLPRAQESGMPAPLIARVERPIRGAETVLLVEDEDAVRQATHEFLERCGYTVLPARDGTEALAIAALFPAHLDLLISDVVMPGMSGRELADQLMTARGDIKVLYVSGYTEGAVLERGAMGLGSMFLQKPFSLNALGQKVREVLES